MPKRLLRSCFFLCGCLLASSAAWAEREADLLVPREYKLQLDPQVALEPLATRLQATLPAQGVAVSGRFKMRKRRDVVFFDTPVSCVLRNAGWILRARGDGGRKQELTLKRRGDAVSPAKAQMQGTREVSFKREEDVSPPASVALSDAWSRQSKHAMVSLQDARDLFPVLRGLDSLPDEGLLPVAGLQIHEQTYELLRFSFDAQQYPLEASVWTRPDGRPLLIEVSFRFDNSAVGRKEALRIFAALQTQAGVLPAAQSKTEAIYQADPSFCRR